MVQYERLEDWAGRLKALALKHGIPIIVLSQLNRDVMLSYRPSLANLRGSDGIGNAADVVLLLNRPNDKDRRNVEIILEKNREGETGDFKAEFYPERVSFGNVIPKKWKNERNQTSTETGNGNGGSRNKNNFNEPEFD